MHHLKPPPYGGIEPIRRFVAKFNTAAIQTTYADQPERQTTSGTEDSCCAELSQLWKNYEQPMHFPSLLTVVGARPQFIKAAPVSKALVAAGIKEILVHTGQHFDALMSDIFFEELDLQRPAYNLQINSLSHAAMTGRMLEKLEEVMLTERPDAVLIYGDTNSTTAGALAAAKLHIPVIHVEAGLRSFNRRMPEEINRIVADHLSTLLLCPTNTAVMNLVNEGITKGVHAVGDVMYDTTVAAIERAQQKSKILKTLQLTPKSYAVSTIHRAENTEDPARFAEIIYWLEEASSETPIVLAVHPRTRDLLVPFERKLERIKLIPPLGYLDMTQLVHNATAIFTDSGGLQKEAYFHRIPCVTLRDQTEWVETIDAGWNRLWTSPKYSQRQNIDDFGDGHAASKIAEILVALFNSDGKPSSKPL